MLSAYLRVPSPITFLLVVTKRRKKVKKKSTDCRLLKRLAWMLHTFREQNGRLFSVDKMFWLHSPLASTRVYLTFP